MSWSWLPVADGMDSSSEAGDIGGSETVPPRPTFEVRVSDTSAGVLVHLDGELDVETTSWFLESLGGSFTAGEDQEVELDLSGLTFLDVAGVRALVRVHDQVTSEGGRVKVCGLDDIRLPAARVLGLGQYFGARTSGQDESY